MDPHIFADPDPGSQNLADLAIRILSTDLNTKQFKNLLDQKTIDEEDGKGKLNIKEHKIETEHPCTP